MSQITLSLLGSSALTMTSATKVLSPVGRVNQASTFAAPVARLEPLQKASDGAVEINDLIADLCIADPRLDAAIEEGRRWIGRTLLSDEPSSLRALRLAAGMSQQQLASSISSSQSYIAKLEAGTVEPGVNQVKRLADALGLPGDVVFNALVVDKGGRKS